MANTSRRVRAGTTTPARRIPAPRRPWLPVPVGEAPVVPTSAEDLALHRDNRNKVRSLPREVLLPILN